VQLRKFQRRDLPRIYELACTSLSENYSPSIFLDISHYWPEGFMVLESGNEIVGFVFGIVMSALDARILMLAVDARARDRGIGTVLYNEFRKECAKMGVHTITLEVRVSNTPAIHFYEKNGFQMVGRLDKYYSNGEDAFRMQTFL